MKILVFGQQLDIGGSQTNAIELAASLRDNHGFEFVYFATPGPMVELIKSKGLRYIPAPDALTYPSPTRMRALRNLVRIEKPDLIHAWDWWQCLDTFYSVYLPLRIPILVSHMMMDLTHLLPKKIPTTYGTPQLCDLATAEGRKHVKCLVPPVDVHINSPNVVDALPFCKQYDITKNEITLVTVSRLHSQLKSESLFRTMEAVRLIGRDLPIRFILVGDGDIRNELETRAAAINTELGRSAIVLTGELIDPRPAYTAADIVIGMGGSALRGMAFGKPVIIVGESGFSAPLTPNTADMFYYQGIYGRGNNNPNSNSLVAAIQELLENSDGLTSLGSFSRDYVVRHFSLETLSAQLAEYYREAAATTLPFPTALAEGMRTGAITLIEGKAIPYWALRKIYHRLGGPPIFPAIRNIRDRFKANKDVTIKPENKK